MLLWQPVYSVHDYGIVKTSLHCCRHRCVVLTSYAAHKTEQKQTDRQTDRQTDGQTDGQPGNNGFLCDSAGGLSGRSIDFCEKAPSQVGFLSFHILSLDFSSHVLPPVHQPSPLLSLIFLFHPFCVSFPIPTTNRPPIIQPEGLRSAVSGPAASGADPCPAMAFLRYCEPRKHVCWQLITPSHLGAFFLQGERGRWPNQALSLHRPVGAWATNGVTYDTACWRQKKNSFHCR